MDYDLEERTAKFGEDIIGFLRKIPRDEITRPLISQLIRSATSIGANYCEANEAASKKDFRNKICICKKETNETKHWLKMLIATDPGKKERIFALLKECHELLLIFQAITSSMSKNKN